MTAIYISDLSIKSLESLEKFDKSLNFPGYLPLISNLTGCIRVYLGTIESVVAFALLFFTCFLIVYPLIRPSVALLPVLMIPKKITELFFYGVTDIIRGTIEQFPLLGNIVCYIYDFSKETLIERYIPTVISKATIN
jgi:hypothetical protein